MGKVHRESCAKNYIHRRCLYTFICWDEGRGRIVHPWRKKNTRDTGEEYLLPIGLLLVRTWAEINQQEMSYFPCLLSWVEGPIEMNGKRK